MKRNEVMKLLDESMIVEDSVTMMKGLSIMFEEFLEGNTISDCSTNKSLYVINRMTDIMLFAAKTLSAGADKLQNDAADLQSRILDVLSDER